MYEVESAIDSCHGQYESASKLSKELGFEIGHTKLVRLGLASLGLSEGSSPITIELQSNDSILVHQSNPT